MEKTRVATRMMNPGHTPMIHYLKTFPVEYCLQTDIYTLLFSTLVTLETRYLQYMNNGRRQMLTYSIQTKRNNDIDRLKALVHI